MDRAVLTVSTPLFESEFGFTLPELGMMFTAFFWAYAAMQIPAGMLVTRFGPRNALFGAIILWSAMTALTPFATTFFALLTVRILLGIGQSADWPASIVGINRLFPGPQRSSANAILLCALYAGPVVGAPLTGWLLGLLGLRGVFLSCGVIGFLFAAIFLAFYGRDDSGKVASKSLPPHMPLAQIVGARRAWILAAGYACTASFVSFYLSWFPTYLAKARGLELESVGIYAGLSSAALCISALCGGHMTRLFERMSRTARAARCRLGAAALLLAGATACIVPFVSSVPLAVLTASVSLTALGFSQVVTWTVVQEIGQAQTGSLTGFINLAGNLAAGAAPLISAMLVTHSGSWTSSFMFLGGVGLIGALIWMRIRADEPLADLAQEPSHNSFTVSSEFQA